MARVMGATRLVSRLRPHLGRRLTPGSRGAPASGCAPASKSGQWWREASSGSSDAAPASEAKPHVRRLQVPGGSAVDSSVLPSTDSSLYRVKPWERRSLFVPENLMQREEDLSDFVEDEIKRLAPMKPRRLSMQEVLDMLQPERIAKFLHVEVPVRYAERLRWVEDIPNWQEVPSLEKVYKLHHSAFGRLRLVKRKPNLDAFTEVVRRIVADQQDVQHDLAMAMHYLHETRGDEYGSDFADEWLDKFLLNCIGTETLMSQYLACVEMDLNSGSPAVRPRTTFSAGIIQRECDVVQICRDAAELVVEMTVEFTGKAPLVRVENHTEKDVPEFSYIPGFLKFILVELLKNSCRATAELVRSDRELSKRPIDVIVCGDGHRVNIRIQDRARGIPYDVGQHVWSYLYSTAAQGISYGEKATSLAGYGVGLPLSRLYARYLGGSLNLVSLPGYGTSVDLYLTRLGNEQVEVVPDDDDETYSSVDVRLESL